MSKQARHFYEFGTFRLDADDRLLQYQGEPVEISPQTLELLLALIEKAGRVVPREELVQRLWPKTSVGENSLPQAVAALRRVLSRDSGGQGHVETIPKRGYLLRPEVREVWDEVPEAPLPHFDAIASAEFSRQAIAAAPQLRLRSLRIVLGLLFMTGALVTVYFLGFRKTPSSPDKEEIAATSIATHRPRRTIAVIGIRNLAPNPEDAWLSTALSEMFNSQLEAGGQMRLLPGNEVARAKADLGIGDGEELTREKIAQITGLLGAEITVSGTYVVLENGSRNSIRLDLSVRDSAGDVIASASETAQSTELLEVVERAAASLRSKLGWAPTSDEQMAATRSSWPANPEAGRHYSEGLNQLRSFEVLAARDSFEKAICTDAEFPLSHMRLAEAWSVLGYDEKAKDEAKKAFDLSGALSQEQRLWVEGNYREMAKEWDLAIAIYARLREFSPDEPDYALELASAQVSAGKLNEALNTLDLLRREPLSEADRPRVDLAEALACERDTARELQAARRARSEGELQDARFLTARATLLESYSLGDSGHPQEGIEVAKVAQRLFSDVGDRLGFARATIYQGNLLRTLGTLDERKALYEKALAVCREIGNKRCEAGALNNLAGVAEDEADFSKAERVYRQSLTVRQEIGDTGGVALAFNNLGTTQELQAKLAVAKDSYTRAREQYRKISYKPGEGMALANSAEIERLRGNMTEAKRMAEESVSIWQETGQQNSFHAVALGTLGDVAFRQNDLDSAETLYQRGIRMSDSIGDKATAFALRVSLAGVWLERNRLSDAEEVFRQSRDFFREQKQTSQETVSQAWLMKALLRSGRTRDAEGESVVALQLASGSSDKIDSTPLILVLAQLGAAGGKFEAAERTLTDTLKWAEMNGVTEYALEAKLALAKMEAESGKAVGRIHLSEVRAEAQNCGFVRISLDATHALQGDNSRPIASR
jgi:DNA-binding winged helix-turn-helix (wHTH) protein/tetratricopeptide (TPR) repeat protein